MYKFTLHIVSIACNVAKNIQVVYEEVEFPAVSFCNLNPIRRSQLTLEENIDLTEVIESLDQATADQLSGVPQTDRRRRRRRRRSSESPVESMTASSVNDVETLTTSDTETTTDISEIMDKNSMVDEIMHVENRLKREYSFVNKLRLTS